MLKMLNRALHYFVQRRDTQPPYSGIICFNVLEPIGYKSPSFSSVSKLASFDIQAKKSFALTCPAQAYPVPIFRWAWLTILFNVTEFSEPIGSKSPTFYTDDSMVCEKYRRKFGITLSSAGTPYTSIQVFVLSISCLIPTV